jgi:tetratricopeptide (TPR) repeat protein
MMLSEPLASVAADKLAMNDVVEALTSYSLARRTATGLIIHRLVQAVIRETPQLNEEKHPLVEIIEVLRSDLPDEIYEYDRSRDIQERWREQLPHVLAVTGHYNGIAPTDGEAVAWLLHHAGTTLGSIDSPATTHLLTRAVEIYETIYGPDHPLIGTVLTDLGWHLEDTAQWHDAREVLERALRVQEATYGSQDPRVAAVLTHLGATLTALGWPSTARSLLERALQIHTEESGRSHPATATTLNVLALALQALGDPASAKPLLERAVEIRQTVFGHDHPWTATHMTNLGAVLVDLGELSAARSILDEALHIRESAFGPNSTNVAHTLYHLGRVLKELGEPEAAEPLLRRALHNREVALGADHQFTQLTRTLLFRLWS